MKTKLELAKANFISIKAIEYKLLSQSQTIRNLDKQEAKSKF